MDFNERVLLNSIILRVLLVMPWFAMVFYFGFGELDSDLESSRGFALVAVPGAVVGILFNLVLIFSIVRRRFLRSLNSVSTVSALLLAGAGILLAADGGGLFDAGASGFLGVVLYNTRPSPKLSAALKHFAKP